MTALHSAELRFSTQANIKKVIYISAILGLTSLEMLHLKKTKKNKSNPTHLTNR